MVNHIWHIDSAKQCSG